MLCMQVSTAHARLLIVRECWDSDNMYNDDRSDFAAPIAAFLFIALASLISMVYVICIDSEIWENDLNITYFLCIGGLVIAGFNLYKGYLAEGFSVALFALFLACFDYQMSIPLAVGLGLLFAFCAMVSFKTGIMDLAVIDAIAAVVSVVMLGVEVHEAVRSLICILGFVPAAIALYVAFCDWTFAQEIIESYEDEFLGDDDECECCCEDHPDDCTCECCSEAKEEAPAEEPAESEEAPAEEAPAEEPAEEVAEVPASEPAEEAPAESEESEEKKEE